MRHFYLIALLLALFSSGCNAQRQDSIEVCRLLSAAPDSAGTLYFARQLKGRPYVAHTLEVNDTEQLVVNLRQLDCTTLVENATALALCVQHDQRTFEAFCHWLTQLRYRQGRLDGYPSRLHYFTDWINDNVGMNIVSHVEGAPFKGVQTVKVDYMSKHPSLYKALAAHPELVPVIAEQERILTGQKHHYLPKSEVKDTPQLRHLIRDGDIIAITCTKAGLDIAHVGIAVWHRDGLHMLHASSQKKKVIEDPMPLSRYLADHPSFTGIRLVRVQRTCK